MADKTDALFPNGAALIFGGSGGIGSVVAKELGRAGSNVAIAYRTKKDVAQKVADEITALGVRASVHQTDIRDLKSVEATVAAAGETHGRVHTLVLGAGPVVPQVYLSEMSDAQWRDAVSTELEGCFNILRASLPKLRAWGGGSYVHLGSAGHLRWPDKDGLSVVPKAANEALMKGVAREEGRNNIRANTVLVGVIDAGMFHELTKQGAFPQAWVEETQKALALKRWGQPEEIGHAVAFLASNKAAYITGQQIAVAGGYGI
ncbi:MAG: SDR family oxidoreductase [Hyphomonadaceae bacterium]|nr:SDR family oxidoreductase [Hyphomonadaceae bacterium]